MCGRYGFTVESEEAFLTRFELENAEFELRDSYNVAPTQEMPVIERHSPNSVHLRTWGVHPAWSPMVLINSKIEKLAHSRFWSKPFTMSRCIVPASYFFEWQKQDDGKQPYLIRLKSNEMYGFAGLVVSTKGEDGIVQTGYTIITQPAGSFMSEIHHRQPCILQKEDEAEWLNPDNSEPEKLLDMLSHFSYESHMEKYPVSTLVNKVANNFEAVTRPFE